MFIRIFDNFARSIEMLLQLLLNWLLSILVRSPINIKTVILPLCQNFSLLAAIVLFTEVVLHRVSYLSDAFLIARIITQVSFGMLFGTD